MGLFYNGESPTQMDDDWGGTPMTKRKARHFRYP